MLNSVSSVVWTLIKSRYLNMQYVRIDYLSNTKKKGGSIE